MSEEMNVNQNVNQNPNSNPYGNMNQAPNGNPYGNMNQAPNGNPYGNMNGVPYQQPVTFVNPMQQAPKKPMDRDTLISWIIRGVLILSEILFLLPQCLISCSYYEEKKWVGGLQAVFGFEFCDTKVSGVWWFIFVFLITGIVIALWFVKDTRQ